MNRLSYLKSRWGRSLRQALILQVCMFKNMAGNISFFTCLQISVFIFKNVHKCLLVWALGELLGLMGLRTVTQQPIKSSV